MRRTVSKTITRTGAALAVSAVLAGGAFAANPQQMGGVAFVTNGKDSGEGSLRYALQTQQASRVIISPRVSAIDILGTLKYAGRGQLTIRGRGQSIRTDQNVTLLAVTEGADLTVSDLSFEGPGGFSIVERGDIGQEAGKGIFVDVRDDQTGTVELDLRGVSVSGVANYGIHVSDCSLVDDCGGGSGGGGAGSPASIAVTLNGVTVDDVGNGTFDGDGLRVDDRGDGDILLSATRSSFTNVGADGLELDEGDAGDVQATVRDSVFSDNGGYCDPDSLKPFLPDPDEAEFDISDKATVDDVPVPVSDSPDDNCFEREIDFFDSGYVEAYEFGIDLDDGIDFDEAGPGSLIASMTGSTIARNLDEGVDFDEENAGDARVRFVNSEAFDNADDGFKISEEDAGAVDGAVRNVTSTGNGGKGVVFEEEDTGDLRVSAIRLVTSNNDDGDDTGLEVAQEEPGSGHLRVRGSDIDEGIDTDGVDEN